MRFCPARALPILLMVLTVGWGGVVEAAVLEPAVERRLTNVRGGFVDARVVEVTETHVKVVRLSDQSAHEIALSGLCEADREFAAVVLATGKPPESVVEAPPPKPYAEALRDLEVRDVEKIPDVLATFFDAFEREPADSYTSALASRVWMAANRVPRDEGMAERVTKRVETLLARKDLRPGQQEALHRVLLYPKIGKELAPWRTGLDEFTARFPDSPDLAALELHYVRVLRRSNEGDAKAHLEKLSKVENGRLAAAATKELAILKKIEEAGPIQSWRFTAMDGREVDLGKMRGKVVVVYFWTKNHTLSQKGLETLKRLYDAHGGKGLEVVGIVLEMPQPTAEEATEKLKAFIATNALPWPNYTELAGMDTSYLRAQAVGHSGHATVLDKEGKVQPGCLREDALVKKVEELLAQ